MKRKFINKLIKKVGVTTIAAIAMIIFTSSAYALELPANAISTALTSANTTGPVAAMMLAQDPLAVIDNLSNFIFGLIRAVGIILLGWGIVQVGLSLQSHDPSQRSNGFLTLAGGIIITFAKEILEIIIS